MSPPTNKSVSQVAKNLGINPGTLTSWVTKDKLARGERLDPDKVDPARLRELETEVAELKMERDVLKRSVVLGSKRRRGDRGVVHRLPED